MLFRDKVVIRTKRRNFYYGLLYMYDPEAKTIPRFERTKTELKPNGGALEWTYKIGSDWLVNEYEILIFYLRNHSGEEKAFLRSSVLSFDVEEKK